MGPPAPLPVGTFVGSNHREDSYRSATGPRRPRLQEKLSIFFTFFKPGSWQNR